MRHGSLFSGIGGFDLAAQWMGWENVFQVEIDPFCQKVLTKNFPEVKKYHDIKQFNGTEFKGAIDILTGGFPCQDISIAGRGRGITGTRSGLWSEYARIIDEARPSYVVIENSPKLLQKGFETILYTLSEIGYNAEWECLSAEQFGFPHKRERIFIVAYTDGIGRNGTPIFAGIQKNVSRPSLSDSEAYLFSTLIRPDRTANYENVRMVHGFRKGLDRGRLSGCGNAIVPQVAFEIFKAIEATLTQTP